MEINNAQRQSQGNNSTYNEYMKALAKWKYDCDVQKWLWGHQFFSQQMLMYHQMRSQNNPGRPTNAPQNGSINQQTTSRPASPERREYKIPSLKLRFLAEFSDFSMLYVIRMIYLFTTLQVGFSLEDLNIEYIEVEEMTFDDWVTQIYIALAFRIIAFLYEWFTIWLLGCTPGKLFFKLKVVRCRTCAQVQNNISRAIVTPGNRPSCKSALIRSLLKNLTITLLIPTVFTALFHPQKRTSYDDLSGTIVVMD